MAGGIRRTRPVTATSRPVRVGKVRRRTRRHPVVRRHRAFRRRETLGVLFSFGALVAALGTLHEVGVGNGGEVWMVGFLSCLILMWIAERG